MGAYAPTYASTDMSLISIDLIGTLLVVGVSFASLIGIVIVYKYLKGGKVKF